MTFSEMYSTLWAFSVQTGCALELDDSMLLDDFALELDFAELEESTMLDEEGVFELEESALLDDDLALDEDFALLEDLALELDFALLELETDFFELEEIVFVELEEPFIELEDDTLLELDETFWEEEVNPSCSSGPAPVLLSSQAENVSPNRADMVMAVTIFFICMRAPLGLISIHNIY